MHSLKALAYLSVCTSAAFAETQPDFIKEIRQEMRRILTPEELASYRGLTIAAMTGIKYEQLHNISTAKELIVAELYGAHRVPSDHPTEVFLFSAGKGLVASFNKFYQDLIVESGGGGLRVADQTLDEIHLEYLSEERADTEEENQLIDRVLDEVAAQYLDTDRYWRKLRSTVVMPDEVGDFY